MLNKIYGPEYHRGISNSYRGEIADKFYRAVFSLSWKVGSIVDIGCSCGVFLEPFYEAGVAIWGVDGDESAFHPDIRCVPREFLEVHDLRNPYHPSKQFDVCLCTETLEHIEPEFTDVILDSISRCSDRLFITVAVPGQGGVGHVNLLPIKKWAELFRERGFRKRRGRLPKAIRDWPTLLVMERR